MKTALKILNAVKKNIMNGISRSAPTWKELLAEGVNYSVTSMARTRTARLLWMIRTLFFSPYKILPVAQENKYLGICSYFIMELYVVCIH